MERMCLLQCCSWRGFSSNLVMQPLLFFRRKGAESERICCRGVAVFVESRMSGLGASPVFADPCAWYWPIDGHVYALACCHVGGLIVAGDGRDPEWIELRPRIKQFCQWGAWCVGLFRFAVVQIIRFQDGSVSVDRVICRKSA